MNYNNLKVKIKMENQENLLRKAEILFSLDLCRLILHKIYTNFNEIN